MNKRQIKKRKKIINDRYDFFNQHIIIEGRRSAKHIYQELYKKLVLVRSTNTLKS